MNQLAVDPEHKFYHPEYVYAKVYLNDVEQKLCTVVDADAGWLERYVTNDGKVFLKTDGTYATEIVRGDIRIEMRKPNETR